jgi:hypothetical protein
MVTWLHVLLLFHNGSTHYIAITTRCQELMALNLGVRDYTYVPDLDGPCRSVPSAVNDKVLTNTRRGNTSGNKRKQHIPLVFGQATFDENIMSAMAKRDT